MFHICTLFYLQCKWYKGKTEIKKSEIYEIEQDGLTHRLIIHSATLNDTGKYRCTFDDQSTFCNLTVRGTNSLHKIQHVIKSIHINLLITLFHCIYAPLLSTMWTSSDRILAVVLWFINHCLGLKCIKLLNGKITCILWFYYFQYKAVYCFLERLEVTFQKAGINE